MEKKTPNYFNILIEVLFLIIVFLAPTIFDRRIGIVFSLTKATTIRAFTFLILGVWASKIIITREHKFMRVLADWPVLTYMLACTVATVTSVHTFTSLFGFYGRYEGLITLYNYALLFFIVTNYLKTRASLKRIFATVLCAGTVMSIYGILQRHLLDPYSWGGVVVWQRVIATIGQPNFLAAYMDMAFILGLALFLFEGEENPVKPSSKNLTKDKGKSKTEKYKIEIDLFEGVFPVLAYLGVQFVFLILIYSIKDFGFFDVLLWYVGFAVMTALALYFSYNFEKINPVIFDVLVGTSLVLIYICLLYTQSRGGYLGILFGGTLFVVLTNRKILFRHWRKASIIFLIIFFLTSYIMTLPEYSPLKRFVSEVKIEESKPSEGEEVKIKTEEQSESKIELSGAAGSRAETWKSAFKIISDYPLFGIGQEVLKMIFPRYETELFRFKEAFHVKQDRCHNSVFDQAVTRGIISLLIFIWLLATVYFVGIKKLKVITDDEGNLIISACLAAIAAYKVQNQFSFGVVAIGSLFWIMMGIVSIIDEEKETSEERIKPLSIESIPWLPISFVWVLVLISLYISGIPFQADKYYKSGKVFSDRRMINEALRDLDISMSINPYEGGTNTYFGLAHINKAYNEQDPKMRREWFNRAIKILKRATLIDPYNADNFYILGKVYLNLFYEGDQSALLKSLKNSEKAIAIDPYYAEAYYNAGIVYERIGQPTIALANYEKAFMINPSLTDPMRALISLYSRLNLKDKAIETMEEAYKKYPSSKEVIQNLVFAYINAKRFDDAIEKLKKLPLDSKEDKVRANLSLGLAYLEKGDFKSALEYYNEVIILDPTVVDAYNNIGFIYFKQGLINKAKEKFHEALSIDPNNAYAKDMLKKLGEK